MSIWKPTEVDAENVRVAVPPGEFRASIHEMVQWCKDRLGPMGSWTFYPSPVGKGNWFIFEFEDERDTAMLFKLTFGGV